MMEVLHTHTPINMTTSENTVNESKKSPSKAFSGYEENSDNNLLGVEQNSDDDAPKKCVKRRIQHFCESDSDTEEQNKENSNSSLQSTYKTLQSVRSQDGSTISKNISETSCIQKSDHESSSDSSGNSRSDQAKKPSRLLSSSDSESNAPIYKSISCKSPFHKVSNENSSDSDQEVKNVQQQMRMKNKRDKIKEKFKNFKSSQSRGKSWNVELEVKNSMSHISEDSNDEVNSIEKIKLKIKKKISLIPSICDPDTSDDENAHPKLISKHKKDRRIKLTSPKPQRMSAKQAMENMQKIRSESNRMLREKEVSLPYHRPKALSLKDIMNRRKPALSADGKSLPIKMNEDQLRLYSNMLEERQKEMKELWQSDTDEENDKISDNDLSANIVNDYQTNDVIESTITESKSINEETCDMNKKGTANIEAEESDKLFDDLSQSIIDNGKLDINKEKYEEEEAQPTDNVNEEQDSENNMTLVFDDSKTSVNEEDMTPNKSQEECCYEKELEKFAYETTKESIINNKNKEHEEQIGANTNTEVDSQHISLHFDTEKDETEKLDTEDFLAEIGKEKPDKIVADGMEVDAFSDDDMNMDDIDNIIENADIIRDIEDKVNSQVLIRDRPLNLKPKLTGAPGMVINLDDSRTIPKKSGVELLKERFTFFAQLKTPEEIEREKKTRIKPGHQHLKLKQELEAQMAEQRSLEWEKRLEEEKRQQKELKEIRGEESEDENDIDKIEAALEEKEAASEQVSESEEDELVEDDIEMKDKPKAKNPMLENEAEESDCDDETNEGNEGNANDEKEDETENEGDGKNDDDVESSYSESSESEDESQPCTKKGRILKAFEDSDDEETPAKVTETNEKSEGSGELLGTQSISQDDILTLAQRHKSGSEDLFTSQGSSLMPSQMDIIKSTHVALGSLENVADLGTQTFSILNSSTNEAAEILDGSDKLDAISVTQPFIDNLDAIAGMCSGSFSQSILPLPITQISQSQPIGEDVLAMCTGKFYDNEFISQVNDNDQIPLGASQEYDSDENSPMTFDKVLYTDSADANANKETVIDKVFETKANDANKEATVEKLDEESKKSDARNLQSVAVDDNLKSILDELDDPEFDTPKPNKFFCGAKTQKTENSTDKIETLVKKKFIIDSEEETNEGDGVIVNLSEKNKRRLKKKRLEKRALQISDDEEMSDQDKEDDESEIEENEERLVEYDSEENEIEIKPQNLKQSKKKKTTEFFEQEAELTSEDEWVGSGDEDEAGLDRMEREEGDDESFHQGRLQRELGQIHMRDVLDQDKREVRIIQELLFEDGDLGGGGRQRKFKWSNLGNEDETGAVTDELRDTQEDEFESEEQWRKQRHERETFLRQMQNNSELDDSLNVSINRSTIIKANLMSKTMSMLIEENQPAVEKSDTHVVIEKKTIPSPKKPFSLLQQSYQGSILNRGKGALARLAALATPLAVDDDAPKGKSAAQSSGRNFVFAALTPEAPKVAKRKADTNPGTPKLVKKMKTEEKQNMSKSRLLDHMKL